METAMETDMQDFSTVTLTPAGSGGSLFEQIKNPQSSGNGRSVPGGDAMEKLPRWRRRQTLVNLEHQLKFTSVLLVQMTAVMLVLAAFAWFESRNAMDLVLRHLGDFPGTSHELHLNNQALLFKIILAVAGTGIIQVLFGIYASHKLAGPVHKMTAVLDRAARGDYSQRVVFRTEDELEALAGSLNRALATLSDDQKRALAEVEAIEQAIGRLVRAGSGPDPAQETDALRARLSALAGMEHKALELETVGS